MHIIHLWSDSLEPLLLSPWISSEDRVIVSWANTGKGCARRFAMYLLYILNINYP